MNIYHTVVHERLLTWMHEELNDGAKSLTTTDVIKIGNQKVRAENTRVFSICTGCLKMLPIRIAFPKRNGNLPEKRVPDRNFSVV